MSDWHFEITCRAGQVSVLEYQDHVVTPLKNNGEESWEISPDFWDWLKAKISYAGEPVSFVIISDDGLFEPPPACFQLDSHNTCYQTVAEGCVLHAYPELTTQPEKPTASTPIPPQPRVKAGSLQDYFIRQTQKYQEGD